MRERREAEWRREEERKRSDDFDKEQTRRRLARVRASLYVLEARIEEAK